MASRRLLQQARKIGRKLLLVGGEKGVSLPSVVRWMIKKDI